MTADRAFNGFGTNFDGNPEPIYGQLFLPRKFKVAVTGARSQLCPRGQRTGGIHGYAAPAAVVPRQDAWT